VTLELPNRLFTANLFEPKSYVKILLACLLGGNIKGLCQKAGTLPDSISSIYDVMQCPDCAQGGHESGIYKKSGLNLYLCKRCDRQFSPINKILFLFEKTQFEQLYPEYT
jgi:ribosomal protein S14